MGDVRQGAATAGVGGGYGRLCELGFWAKKNLGLTRSRRVSPSYVQAQGGEAGERAEDRGDVWVR